MRNITLKGKVIHIDDGALMLSASQIATFKEIDMDIKRTDKGSITISQAQAIAAAHADDRDWDFWASAAVEGLDRPRQSTGIDVDFFDTGFIPPVVNLAIFCASGVAAVAGIIVSIIA